MAHILVRPVLFVVIALSLCLSAGCSGQSGGPYDQANSYVREANEAIDEHNRLFKTARSTYEEAREAGEDTTEEAGRMARARETMQEARGELEGAREPLSEMQDLDVEPEIKEYATLLSQAMDAQIAAENREIRYYEILEQDPALAENRKEAEDILAEAGAGYEEAKDTYDRAHKLADANPELLRKS